MTLTSKERNFLRRKAHDIQPIVRIGKSGLNENVLDSINDAISTKELIKIKILSNSDEKISYELADEIEKYTKATAVYLVGHTMIFFKENKKGPITAEFMEFRKSNK